MEEELLERFKIECQKNFTVEELKRLDLEPLCLDMSLIDITKNKQVKNSAPFKINTTILYSVETLVECGVCSIEQGIELLKS